MMLRAETVSSSPVSPRSKSRNALAAGGVTVGWTLGLLALREASLVEFSSVVWRQSFVLAISMTLFLAWLAHAGWTQSFEWDPYWALIPLLIQGWLLCALVVMAPEARAAMLIGYQVVLLLYAGLLSFWQVFALGCSVTAGYQLALYVVLERGHDLERLPLELAASVFFLASQLLTGLVFQRLKNDRGERLTMGHRLAGLALTDGLTSLPNRRYFEESAAREVERCLRYGYGFAVLMVDVDNFKACNDEFGHAAGDQLLEEVARTLVSGTRESDFVARFGGDEFAALLPRLTPESARDVAERLRKTVATLVADRSPAARGAGITLSVGVAFFPENGETIAGVMESADAALYEAKRQGRNCVVVAHRPAQVDTPAGLLTVPASAH